jgi:ABC-2 type transport system ATP-binding protein
VSQWVSNDTQVILAVSELAVDYGSFWLGPITFRLGSGEVAYLLGPNGSGKTSLVRAVVGLNTLASGRVTFREQNLLARQPDLLSRIGYLSDSPEDTIPELTPWEYWQFCSLSYERFGISSPNVMERAGVIADVLQIPLDNQAIAELSLGTQRKVQLVAACLHEPELLIFDEPLIGFDFISCRAFERFLESERRRGATIWLTSHDLAMVARTADRMLLLYEGHLLQDAAVSHLGGSSLVDYVEQVLTEEANTRRARIPQRTTRARHRHRRSRNRSHSGGAG